MIDMATIRDRLLDPALLPPDRLELLRRVARRAEEMNLPAYLVGGVVRDLLLGRRVKDFDVVIEGDAARLARALAKSEGGEVIVHSRFGTATWTPDGFAIDLISARAESYESPGALPTVKFAGLDDDLRRRDFTINAIAARLDEAQFGELIDPLDGRADLEGRSIRVLHPRSFTEDPTRMLRAVRYAVRYEFDIAAETAKLIDGSALQVLSNLSGERLRHELDVVFEEAAPSQVLERLNEMGLLKSVHPELAGLDHRLPPLIDPPSEWGEFRSDDILTLTQAIGWTIWLSALPEAQIDHVAGRLAFPALLREAATAASRLRAGLPALSGARPSEWTARLDTVPPLAVYAVHLRTQASRLRDYLAQWRHVRSITTGEDLKRRAIPPGPIYHTILSRLRAARLDGEVTTSAEESRLLERLLSDSDI